MENANKKAVFTVVRSNDKSRWVRVGIGFINRDGSMNLYLDALPANGELQVRDWESDEQYRERRAAAAAAKGSGPQLQALG